MMGLRPEVPGTEAEVADKATIVLALFQGLAQLRRLHPEAVPPELFGQALLWLRAGAALGTAASADDS